MYLSGMSAHGTISIVTEDSEDKRKQDKTSTSVIHFAWCEAHDVHVSYRNINSTLLSIDSENTSTR